MKSVEELVATPFTGSELTKTMIKNQILERWGEAEAERYNPYQNARTWAQWTKLGFRVKKGQTALRSVTYIDSTNERGEAIKIPRTISLFYRLQVEKV
ncbi:MAG: hypothetical protein WC217_01555 [Candidatus Paceibacterota bacterium]|jgi:hypothetical protein